MSIRLLWNKKLFALIFVLYEKLPNISFMFTEPQKQILRNFQGKVTSKSLSALTEAISGQCFHFITPKDTRKLSLFCFLRVIKCKHRSQVLKLYFSYRAFLYITHVEAHICTMNVIFFMTSMIPD